MTRHIPFILAVALFMEHMDATVIATSLPAIAADIGTTPVALKLAFTAYFVAMAIFIPISAWMADKFGAKNIFRLAILIFVVGSIGCAFSSSLLEFVFARFLKGMGGAMMSPLARLILFRTTPRSGLVNAMAWLTIPAMVAPMTGPPVGGFITTFFSWHWIFIINVPIGLLGFLLVSRFLPEIPSAPMRKFDFLGFVLLGITFAGVLFGLSLMSLPVLPLWVAIASTVAGAIAGIIYLFRAYRIETPLLDPRLFREPVFRTTIIATAIFLIGAGAIPFLLPLMLQIGFGLNPFETGLIVFVAAAGALMSKFFAKRLYATLGFRTALAVAAVLSALIIAVQGLFTPATPMAIMMLIIFMGGIVRSSYFTGQNALVLSEIPAQDAGPATAISTITRPIATALGVALAGGVLEVSTHIRGAELALPDFRVAFITVGVMAAFAAVPLLAMRKDAGSEVSGHKTAEALDRAREEGNEGSSPRF